ncbi:MAG: GntR family transcriptional regulator [Bradyrhizobiaceae bacterium]|nr:MAG: GntR family transcriptional regulator [Bradyrhizobiaceae bacterium]
MLDESTSEPAVRGRGTTVGHVVTHLKDGIFYGRYAPGQRLIEADLTRELGVSRGPLREAFRRLTAEGLIESVPNRGAIVRRLTATETQELFQIRTALEALAARLAAHTIASPGVRARFEAAIAPIWSDRPRDTPSTYLDENRVFHQAVADASGNEQLAALVRQLQLPLIMFQLSGALTPETLAKSNAEHRAIAGAILAGDAAAAAAAITAHLDRAAKFARELPGNVFRSS